MGVIICHDQDFYKPISTMEWHKGFEGCWVLMFVGSPPQSSSKQRLGIADGWYNSWRVAASAKFGNHAMHCSDHRDIVDSSEIWWTTWEVKKVKHWSGLNYPLNWSRITEPPVVLINYHPCMVYFPTFGWYVPDTANASKCLAWPCIYPSSYIHIFSSETWMEDDVGKWCI